VLEVIFSMWTDGKDMSFKIIWAYRRAVLQLVRDLFIIISSRTKDPLVILRGKITLKFLRTTFFFQGSSLS